MLSLLANISLLVFWVSFCGVFVALIHPPAALMKARTRSSAALFWLKVTGAGMVAAIVFSSGLDNENKNEPLNIALGMTLFLATFVWPIYAVGSLLFSLRQTTPMSQAQTSAPLTGLNFEVRDLAEIILADGKVSQNEADKLLTLLTRSNRDLFDSTTSNLFEKLKDHLSDGVLDDDEAEELKTLLSDICDAKPVVHARQPLPISAQPTTLKSKKAQAPKKPTSYSINLPRSTTSSRKTYTSIHSLRSGDRVSFMYEDVKGDFSVREVIVRKVSSKNDYTYLDGRCLTRDAPRTFREDRMTGLCFSSSGEAIR